MLLNLAIALGYATVAWAIGTKLKRVDIIDAFWGPGFVVVALATVVFGTQQKIDPWRVTLLALVGIWGLRLGLHLMTRWWNEEHEDRRYRKMRENGGPWWWLRSLVTVFWLQGAILWVVALPLQQALSRTSEIDVVIFAAGQLLWLVGFAFEAIGDHQLRRFRNDPDNSDRVLNSGLWRYTRHPNYFGDFTVWWGFFAMSFAAGASLWTVIGPLIMSILLMKFSGVGLLESDISSRRPGYSEYVENTNAFFPAPPGNAG